MSNKRNKASSSSNGEDDISEYLEEEQEKENKKQKKEDEKNENLKEIPKFNKTTTTHVGSWDYKNIRHLVSMREINLIEDQNLTTNRLLNRVIEMLAKWWFQFPMNTLQTDRNGIKSDAKEKKDFFFKQSKEEQQVIRDRNTRQLNDGDRLTTNPNFLYLYMLLVVCENIYNTTDQHYPFLENFGNRDQTISKYMQQTAPISTMFPDTVRPAFIRMLYSLHRHHGNNESIHGDATNSPTITLYVMSSIIRHYENNPPCIRDRITQDLDFLRQRLNIEGNISDWLLSQSARDTIGLRPTHINMNINSAVDDELIDNMPLDTVDGIINYLSPTMPWISSISTVDLQNSLNVALSMQIPARKHIVILIMILFHLGVQKHNPHAQMNNKDIEEFMGSDFQKEQDHQEKSELEKIQEQAKFKSWKARNPKTFKAICWIGGILGGGALIAAIVATGQEWLIGPLRAALPFLFAAEDFTTATASVEGLGDYGAIARGTTTLTEGTTTTAGSESTGTMQSSFMRHRLAQQQVRQRMTPSGMTQRLGTSTVSKPGQEMEMQTLSSI